MCGLREGEGDIRKAMIEGGVVDCMIALPGQLFYSTQIPACLWFLAKNRKNGRFRDRSSEILFIDARKLGVMVDRTRREFEDADIAKMTLTRSSWSPHERGLVSRHTGLWFALATCTDAPTNAGYAGARICRR